MNNNIDWINPSRHDFGPFTWQSSTPMGFSQKTLRMKYAIEISYLNQRFHFAINEDSVIPVTEDQAEGYLAFNYLKNWFPCLSGLRVFVLQEDAVLSSPTNRIPDINFDFKVDFDENLYSLKVAHDHTNSSS